MGSYTPLSLSGRKSCRKTPRFPSSLVELRNTQRGRVPDAGRPRAIIAPDADVIPSRDETQTQNHTTFMVQAALPIGHMLEQRVIGGNATPSAFVGFCKLRDVPQEFHREHSFEDHRLERSRPKHGPVRSIVGVLCQQVEFPLTASAMRSAVIAVSHRALKASPLFGLDEFRAEFPHVPRLPFDPTVRRPVYL